MTFSSVNRVIRIAPRLSGLKLQLLHVARRLGQEAEISAIRLQKFDKTSPFQYFRTSNEFDCPRLKSYFESPPESRDSSVGSTPFPSILAATLQSDKDNHTSISTLSDPLKAVDVLVKASSVSCAAVIYPGKDQGRFIIVEKNSDTEGVGTIDIRGLTDDERLVVKLGFALGIGTRNYNNSSPEKPIKILSFS